VVGPKATGGVRGDGGKGEASRGIGRTSEGEDGMGEMYTSRCVGLCGGQ
jgi:hypothetical protein